MSHTLKLLHNRPRWYFGATTRVLQIGFNGTIQSLTSTHAPVSELLPRALDHAGGEIEWSIGETIRRQAAAYFPAEYTISVRFDLVDYDGRTRIAVWIATPQLRWSAALLARRSWSLLIPILQHVTQQGFQECLQGLRVEIDPKSITVTSFAPRRLMTEPLILAAAVGFLATAYWLLAHPIARAWLVP